MYIPNWADPVSHETMERLERYAALIKKWNVAINLVGKTTENDLWDRHIWDSYQLLPLIPGHTLSLVDLGSGAGLPGLVIACARPINVTLVERDQRKSSFLKEAARALNLHNVSVVNEDAIHLRKQYDVITSRALAALPDLLKLAAPLMKTNTFCLFPKGENYATEVEQARKHWSFDHQVIHSKTHEKACIISLSELKRAG